jgi:alkylhydroperoxidase family enzyme
LTDDEIAALDVSWGSVPEKERAAFEFTKRLTVEPHAVGPADVAALKKHYTPEQVLEIVVAVAGYNATNRWTDGLNIPAEEHGTFRRPDGREGPDLKSFKTPTSPKYADAASLVAPLPAKGTKGSAPTWPARADLEPRAKVEEVWKAAQARTPSLPMADGQGPNWERLLNTFPKAGGQRVAGLKAAAEKGNLTPRLKAEIAWACARQDRAWYALAVARDRLKAVGFSADQVFALDGDGKGLPKEEAAAVAFARKLTAAPPTVTDADVEALRKLFTDKQVAEIVHHVCNAAFLNRVTEAANLPLDR